ncbi:hypothetical protein [Bradyrhizobium sp. 27S5]|uniref:hypothetical protein n=1 Tax=Bradyrhizobium sp. 27S5 TaxID=3139728 RepID=UPI0030D52DBA
MRLEFPDHPSQGALDDIGLHNRICQEVLELSVDRIKFNEAVKQMHVTQDESGTREIVLLVGGGLVELVMDENQCVLDLHAFNCETRCDENEIAIMSSRQNPYREFLLEQLAHDLPKPRAGDSE